MKITWLKERAPSCALHFRFASVLLLFFSSRPLMPGSVDKGDHLKAISFHWPMISSLADQLSIILWIHESRLEGGKIKVTLSSSSSFLAFDLFSPLTFSHLLSSTGNERLSKLVLNCSSGTQFPRRVETRVSIESFFIIVLSSSSSILLLIDVLPLRAAIVRDIYKTL